MFQKLFQGVLSLRHSKVVRAVVIGLVALLVAAAVSVPPKPALAHGWCVPGYRYGGAGTSHNYVEFRVNFSSSNWHIHHATWRAALFPADLWAWPDGNGIARAGIRHTDYDPSFPPSEYLLCGYG